MDDQRKSPLADLVYADLMASGARTPREIKAALLESVLSLQSPLEISVGEVTEEDKAARRTPSFTVRLPRLPE